MMYLLNVVAIFSLIFPLSAFAQNVLHGESIYECPQHWIRFQDSCYRFIKSPLRLRENARKNCQAFQSDLLTINSLDEHSFVVYQLLRQDPQHHTWYTGVKYQSGIWINEADSTTLINMDNAFLPEPNDNILGRDYLAYSYSNNLKRWGLEKVTGREMLLYICEAHITTLYVLLEDNRTYHYGVDIDNPLQIPRGPYFIKQPVDKVFAVSKSKTSNNIALSCLASGYPTPTYEWFKEDYKDDRRIAIKIDPLSNSRYTVSGGTLIIYEPVEVIMFLLK